MCKQTIIYLLHFVMVLVLGACNNTDQKASKEHAKKEVVKHNFGEIIQKKCKKNPSLSYHITLPKGYDRGHAYPLLLFFDPHAQAEQTIKRYYELSNEVGVLIACSDNSKNGLSSEQAYQIASVTLKDVLAEYNIDSNNIFLVGFSGGAIIATYTAQMDHSIVDGVIAIGSPMQSNYATSLKLNFIGLVGDHDFNFIEMYKQHMAFKNNKHELLVFDGKHEWPSKEIMQLAIRWQLNNQGKADNTLENDISPLRITNKYSEEDMVMEQMLIQNYLKAIGVKDIDWWKGVVSKKSSDAEIRALNYVSMVCYTYINDLLKKQDLNTAKQLCDLYEVVDPKNPDVYYFKGTISFLEKNNTNALQYFEKAASLGFDDFDRLQNNPALQPMMQLPEFEAVIKKIKENSTTLPLS